MENFTDYLNPELIPLEEKIKDYLNIDKEIKHLQIEMENFSVTDPPYNPENHDLNDTIKKGKYNNKVDEVKNKIEKLLQQQEKLKHQIVDMLPVKDQYVKVDLGYGPSEVGAFTHSDSMTITGFPEYDLMIIH